MMLEINQGPLVYSTGNVSLLKFILNMTFLDFAMGRRQPQSVKSSQQSADSLKTG